jgi:hypothetical protein
VFENRVVRRAFQPKGEEVTKGSRKLHNKEHHTSYCSRKYYYSDQHKGKKCLGHAADVRNMENTYKVSAEISDMQGLAGRPYFSQKGINMDTKEVKNSIFWDITPCSPLKVNRR